MVEKTYLTLTIIPSLLSALASAFLASYFTYWFTERSWRRRRHLEDIKTNCLNEISMKLEDFKRFFEISEGKIVEWIRNGSIYRKLPSIDCSHLFSFGFDEPCTTHYRILLHDLENHFPDLEKKLREFEGEIKELCLEYKELLCKITETALLKAKNVVNSDPEVYFLTEAVVMSLAGYKEHDYPTEAEFLRRKHLDKHIDKIVEDLRKNHAELVNKFVNVRKKAKSKVNNIKKDVVETLHKQKLPGKCKLI